MRLLAIDTSTSAIAVAVHDGERVLDRESVLDPRGHAEQLAPAIARLLTRLELRPAEVTQVVVGTGPGPFTGLRVGLVTAVTFAHALGIGVGGLCSLDALARQVLTRDADGTGGPETFVVATDARRKEIYWAAYRRTGVPGVPGADGVPGVPGVPGVDGVPGADAGFVRVTGPHVDRPADLADRTGLTGTPLAGLPVAGRGGLLYPAAFGPPLGVLDVDAGALADLAAAILRAGGGLPAPAPRYLRRPDARPLPGAPPQPQPAGGIS